MSKRLAELIFEASKAKRVSLPAQITPVYHGVKQASEHPVYVTDKEEDMLRRGTDGKSDETQFGARSFTDPSQAQGNTLSSTPTRTTSQSRAGQSNNTNNWSGGSDSASSRATPSGNFSYSQPSFSSIGTGRAAPVSDSASVRSSGGQNFSFVTPAAPSMVGSSRQVPASQQERDNAWRTVMGSEPPAFGNRVTVASVPPVPGNSGATYTPDAHRVANLDAQYPAAAPVISFGDRGPASADPSQPAPQASDGQSFSDTPSFTDRKTYSGPKGSGVLNTAAYEAGGMSPLAAGITSAAHSVGIDPKVLATAISYETGGSFDPTIKGPVTSHGQVQGLIQFTPDNAKTFGVDWRHPLETQLGSDGAVAQYLKGVGVQPGMGLMNVYAAINAGDPYKLGARDAANGGAPGTVADKVNTQMAGHMINAGRVLFDGYNPPAASTMVAAAKPTVSAFAAPAVDTPPPFTPAQIAAAQPGGSGFAPNGNINPINPNGFVGQMAPGLTQIVNAVANRPYDSRTAATMDALTQPAGSRSSAIVQAVADAVSKAAAPAATPAATPTVQGPVGPAYSIAMPQGNFIVDSHGNYFQIDALGRYVPVAAPVRAA